MNKDQVDSSDIPQERVDETAKQRHEPVAWRFRSGTFFNREVHWRYIDTLEGAEGLLGLEPLYTSPPQRQPEQAQQQEPVAWWDAEALDDEFYAVKTTDHTIPLYTAPPQRQPLTDEQVREIARQYALGLAFPYDSKTTPEMFARAIEAAHGIKGEE